MTVMSIEDMPHEAGQVVPLAGEPSESGGKIERFEGGSQRSSGVFRPSKHSMMISVGYYFDQVSREQMVRRISEQVKLIADAAQDAVGPKDVLWIETPQPVYHDLSVSWTVDGKPVQSARHVDPHSRFLSLAYVQPAPGAQVTVTVIDPTPFVRDPEIRSKVLTATRHGRWGRVAPRLRR
jgi:hypothetical protein